MIFSRWRPDRGGYDYFDSPSTRFGLGDDLPVPRLQDTTAIGVASTDIGRPLPSDAASVGSGDLPRGMIAPMDRSGLGAIDWTTSSVKVTVGLAAALAIGYFIGKHRKKK
jgi:hypothetical protein